MGWFKIGKEVHQGCIWSSCVFDLYIELLLSHSVMSDSLLPYGLKHARTPSPSPPPWACSNSHPLSQWCHPTISSSAIPFSSCLQSFPASGSFLMSVTCIMWQKYWSFTSASILPMNIKDWFLLGLTGLFSLLSRGFSKVFSNITVQKHQLFLFDAQPLLWFNSSIYTWLLEKYSFEYMDLCQQSDISAF